ncbi:hypothetical protein [Brevundimonas diminuta]|uniref:hypothetical protein n=1 Tax=Brevundimonas diminuta TaxID=293 RepID=UPI00320A52A7
MKAALLALSLTAPLVLAATSVSAQQDPAERARIEDLTRRLNGGPTAAPQTSAPQASAPQTAAPATPQARPQAQPQPQPQAAPSRPAPAAADAPVAGRRAPPASGSAAAPAPSPQLDAATRAALPFSIDLPSGFQMVEGRAAPGAHVYAVRKGPKTYLMIYTGPSSQFPIYEGEQVTVGGRVSIIVPDGARRVAMEHLFQRPAEPNEIHVWVMAADGAERDEAERIAQTVDPK